MKALWLVIGAVLTSGCIGPKTEVSHYFDSREIVKAEQFCKLHGGFNRIELKLGDNPHYITHCNRSAPVSVNQFSCESCKSGNAKDSYVLTGDKIKKAREVCRSDGGMVWIQFQLRRKGFVTICRLGATIPL